MRRRTFVRNVAITGVGLGVAGIHGCTSTSQKEEQNSDSSTSATPFFKLSLAQWSIHRMIQEQGLDPYMFASKAKGWGFEGLEYVSQLYMSKADSMGGEGFTTRLDEMVAGLKAEAEANEINSLVMMMDLEEDTGDLAWSDEAKRTRAIEAHYPWIEASKAIGCHSVRINLFGENEREPWKAAAVEVLGTLGSYASNHDMNIIVENHGWLSSDAGLLMEAINEVGMDNVGTLPDFGNFCIKRPNNARWDGCLEEYDRYKGVTEMMPKAFAVSAKSRNFDESGEETETNYSQMLQIVKDSGFTGYIGVEYEGSDLSEEEGILATKNLLLNSVTALV